MKFVDDDDDDDVPLYLINASTLPCKTENMEIASFHVNVSC